MGILVVLIILILCVMLINQFVGIQTLPGLIIFLIVVLLLLGGGWHFGAYRF